MVGEPSEQKLLEGQPAATDIHDHSSTVEGGQVPNAGVAGLDQLGAADEFSAYPLLPADVFALANLADADQFSAYPLLPADVFALANLADADQFSAYPLADADIDESTISVTGLGVGAVADGEFVKNVGGSLVGGTPAADVGFLDGLQEDGNSPFTSGGGDTIAASFSGSYTRVVIVGKDLSTDTASTAFALQMNSVTTSTYNGYTAAGASRNDANWQVSSSIDAGEEISFVLIIMDEGTGAMGWGHGGVQPNDVPLAQVYNTSVTANFTECTLLTLGAGTRNIDAGTLEVYGK